MKTDFQSPLTNWCELPTSMGVFRMYDTGNELLRVVCLGDIREQGARPLVRIHSSCLASEVFSARDCDCADQLRETLKLFVTEGGGIFLHLHQEGRGHGLSLKIRAVGQMQREGLDTAESFDALGLAQDARTYDEALELLKSIGIEQVRLVTNNPRKLRSLEQAGIRAEMVNTHPTVRAENREYLVTKNAKLGHHLPLSQDSEASCEPVFFYHSDQRWGRLSNFAPNAIFLLGKIWPSVEHYYQSQKFAGTPFEEAIRACETPSLAKQRAEQLAPAHQRADWALVKEQVMLDGLRAKFMQHPDLREELLGTGDRRLVEHTKHDAFWGDGADGLGKNRLGVLLMQVRSELRSGASRAAASQEG